jgi:ATP-binding protein involved in chromosome partitioning
MSNQAPIRKEQIRTALMHVVHPVLERDLVSLEMVQDVIVQENYVSFTLEMASRDDRLAQELQQRATDAIRAYVSPDAVVDITVGINLSAAKRQQASDGSEAGGSGESAASGQAGPAAAPSSTSGAGAGASTAAAPSPGSGTAERVLPGVRRILAVASGKGGVGKSTVASNLAVALAARGARVGLMDTDIYGPSVPTMFDAHERPSITTRRKLVPVRRHGVDLVSMGFLIDPDQAMVWRGPMVTSAVKQFMQEVEWGELDYMILDLPPGTGDIQLTIVQNVPLTGAVIVSTPQTVALDDARKGVAMFDKVRVPVLGIVENMAYFSPPDMPEKKYHIFGKHGARRLAERLEVPFLGEIPIVEAIREGGDNGRPVVLDGADSPQGQAFRAMTDRVIQSVEALEAKNGGPANPISITIRP